MNEVIDLIDEDNSPLNATTPPSSPAPRLDASPATAGPSAVEPLTQPASAVAPFQISSLFNDDDTVDDQDTPATQPLTDDNPSSRRLSVDLLDDSDEELRELYQQTKHRLRDSAQSSQAGKRRTTARSSPSRTVEHPHSPPRLSRPNDAGASAAQFLGDGNHAPTEVDPALLEEEGDCYCRPSLYQGSAVPDVPNVNPQQMQQLLELNEKSSDATKEMDTPVEMNSLLMRHQKQALYWMVNRESEDNPPGHPRGGILADDQGFGKTVTMIALLLTNRPEPSGTATPRWGNLIVTPTSVLNQWAAEFKEHIAVQYRPKVLIYHGPNKPRQARMLTKYDVVLTTYGTLATEYPKVLAKHKGTVLKRRKAGNLYKINWFRVVLDEAQAIRNFRRETFKAAATLNARRKWSLTGTPIQNTVNDIYSQFQFLGYHVTETYKEWERRFKKPLEGKRCTPAHFERFQAILGVVLLRRAKYDKIDNKPVIELPPRNTTTLDLKFTKTEKKFYESQEEGAVNRMHREAGTTGNDFALALHIILRLRQACGHPALCFWGTGKQFTFSDDELDVVEMRMKTKCMFNLLPEQVRNRLFDELGPDKSVPQPCPICFEEIEDGVVTKCGHLFCLSDYEAWREENDSCPSCRADLQGDDAVMSLAEVRKEVHAITRKKKREEALLAKTEDRLQTTSSKAEPIIFGSHQGKAEPICLDGPAKIDPISLSAASGKAEPMLLESEAKPEPRQINALGRRGSEPPSSEPSRKRQRLADEGSESAEPLQEDDSLSPDQSDGDSETRASEIKTSTKIRRFLEEYKKIFEETDDKVLCFSQWTRMLDLVEESIIEQGYEYARLDGKMSTTQRDAQVRFFKSRSKCRLFLISLTAGSTGLNLTAANRVFLLDSWWNPAVENQAIDRVHRIGQKKPVEVIKLKIGGTIEERILALQEKKRQIIDGALGVEGLKTVGRRRLTMRDLMGLFQDVAANVASRAETGQNETMATRAQEVLDMARQMG